MFSKDILNRARDAWQKIRVVAMDQHDAYKVSTEKNCTHAILVFLRFHSMQSFNTYDNELRIEGHNPALGIGDF
ncbi:MAG: hypothetical protein EOP04_05390 [Proteobacteria bacterium]|nr:MAG: hypothetical protein EOP04_05390 [Pseudomonadota bacterium]